MLPKVIEDACIPGYPTGGPWAVQIEPGGMWQYWPPETVVPNLRLNRALVYPLGKEALCEETVRRANAGFPPIRLVC